MIENQKNTGKSNKTISEKVKIITNNKYKSLISRANSRIQNFSNKAKALKEIKKNSRTTSKILKTKEMKSKSIKLMKSKETELTI